jgi:hypothetical protein
LKFAFGLDMATNSGPLLRLLDDESFSDRVLVIALPDEVAAVADKALVPEPLALDVDLPASNDTGAESKEIALPTKTESESCGRKRPAEQPAEAETCGKKQKTEIGGRELKRVRVSRAVLGSQSEFFRKREF